MDMSRLLFHIIVLSMYCDLCWAAEMNVFQDPPEVSEGGNIQLFCSIPTPVANTVRWLLPNGTIATSNCNSNPAFTYLNATCDVTDPNKEVFILQIIDVNAPRDDGDYTCSISTVTKIIPVDVHVKTTIEDWYPKDTNITEGQDVTASCSSGCGYPASIKWYKIGGANESLPAGTNAVNTTCNETPGYEKLRNVTNTLVFAGEYMTALMCCVENTIGDRSECRTINVTTFAGVEILEVNEDESSTNFTAKDGEVITASCSTHCVYSTPEYTWLEETLSGNISVADNDTINEEECDKYPTKKINSSVNVTIQKNQTALICCAKFSESHTSFHRMYIIIETEIETTTSAAPTDYTTQNNTTETDIGTTYSAEPTNTTNQNSTTDADIGTTYSAEPTNTTNQINTKAQGGLSDADKIGIGVGVVVGCACITAGAIGAGYIYKSKKKNNVRN